MTRMAPLLLRADADRQIGVGHLARLLALGSAWQAQGGKVRFLGRVPSPALQQQIHQSGAEFVPVGRRHPHPDDLAINSRYIAQMRKEPGSSGAVWTALDGRHFDDDYQATIRAFGSRLLVADDLADAGHYDADLIVNQRSDCDERWYSGCVGRDTTLLLGTRYAMLRPQFARYQPYRTEMPEVAGLVDAAGAARVVAVMRALDGDLATEDVVLRPLEPTDCWPLWRTKPDLSLSATSFSTDPIPPDEHRRWFGEQLANESTRIWVLALHGLIVGTVRYDRVDPATAEISFHVVRSCRRRGLGTRLIAETCDRAGAGLGVQRLRAVVRADNVGSARVFTNTGFREVARRNAQGRTCLVLERSAVPLQGDSPPPLRLFESGAALLAQEAACRRLG